MRMVLSRTRLAALLAVSLPVVAACGGGGADGGGGDDTGSDAPTVVATTGIWADITGMVACDGSFDVHTIVPPGGDAHGYEPSLRDREMLDAAALVVANGLGLEELLEDTLERVEAGGVPVIQMAEHAPDPLPAGEHGHGDEEGEGDAREESEAGHDHDGDDPHVWFDPTRVAAALPELADALVEAGADPAVTDRCLTEAQSTLAALDETVTDILAAVPAERRVLVTNHDALGYFADRYGFEVLGTVLPSTSTLSQASPADLEALGDVIDEAGVPAIFTETLHEGTDAAALAQRLGVEVVELHTDALGEEGSGAENYAGLLTSDAAAIAAALGG